MMGEKCSGAHVSLPLCHKVNMNQHYPSKLMELHALNEFF